MLPGDSFVSRTNDSHCQLSRFTLQVGLALGVLSLVPMAQADIVFSESFETNGQGCGTWRAIHSTSSRV